MLAIIVLSPFLYIALGWTVVLGGMWLFTPNPPQPQETNGEFPFELTYKIDGETITIRDVYVCEYDGVGFNEGNGKYRKWNGYIKGTGETSILLIEDTEREIYCFVGDAEFYMGDEKYPEKKPLAPRLYNVTNNSNVEYVESYSSNEIMEYYKIEIISWTSSDPIENSFD